MKAFSYGVWYAASWLRFWTVCKHRGSILKPIFSTLYIYILILCTVKEYPSIPTDTPSFVGYAIVSTPALQWLFFPSPFDIRAELKKFQTNEYSHQQHFYFIS